MDPIEKKYTQVPVPPHIYLFISFQSLKIPVFKNMEQNVHCINKHTGWDYNQLRRISALRDVWARCPGKTWFLTPDWLLPLGATLNNVGKPVLSFIHPSSAEFILLRAPWLKELLCLDFVKQWTTDRDTHMTCVERPRSRFISLFPVISSTLLIYEGSTPDDGAWLWGFGVIRLQERSELRN